MVGGWFLNISRRRCGVGIINDIVIYYRTPHAEFKNPTRELSPTTDFSILWKAHFLINMINMKEIQNIIILSLNISFRDVEWSVNDISLFFQLTSSIALSTVKIQLNSRHNSLTNGLRVLLRKKSERINLFLNTTRKRKYIHSFE